MKHIADSKTARDLSWRMAEAMVGREVSVRGKAAAVHGIVTTVLLDAGEPRIVVGGSRYSLNTVLTVIPLSVGQATSHAE